MNSSTAALAVGVTVGFGVLLFAPLWAGILLGVGGAIIAKEAIDNAA